MNIDFLKNQILPQRKKEISKGENCNTAQPIYVVLDLQEHYTNGHSEYTLSTNHKGIKQEYGYIDESKDFESKKFKYSEVRMKEPIEATRFYTDRIVAFFLTRKGAKEYLKYQKHNLSKPYIYVFNAGYGNKEMNLLLDGE